ncbi:hypothetical protein SAMN02745119_02001 [Trichlorobacter thiogenes]|uniref:Uncharacterized protein n=1 Tax=Trichlorobacter thiogenes TaxID=115783 RepID=A0A1T4PJY5_9BACT|nr:hypothetical protein [Trichlorobacter thiogenes]SJZ91885.1 hypothetical protein SAMN02745119_02001 [Trichlorobacter thiogenes]
MQNATEILNQLDVVSRNLEILRMALAGAIPDGGMDDWHAHSFSAFCWEQKHQVEEIYNLISLNQKGQHHDNQPTA